MCWVCGVHESPQKVKLGELKTQPERRWEGCSPTLCTSMNVWRMKYYLMVRALIILFVVLEYNCRLGISVFVSTKGNVSNKGRSNLVVKLWSAWEVGDNLWGVGWLLLHVCRSGTLNKPLLHSSWWGSVDEGGKLTSQSAIKALLTLFTALMMTWLPS